MKNKMFFDCFYRHPCVLFQGTFRGRTMLITRWVRPAQLRKWNEKYLNNLCSPMHSLLFSFPYISFLLKLNKIVISRIL